MKYNYISSLRTLACFFIVVAHSICTPIIYYSDLYSSVCINLTTILTVILRGGVQIFFMISGVLFLDTSKEIKFEKIIKKYVSRILLGIIIFGTTFALMELIFIEKSFSLKILFIAMINMIQNESWGHLWYLYTLVGLYLVTPIQKSFINNSSDKDFYLFLVILFLFNIIFPFVNQMFNIKIGFNLPFVSAALFYYVLGVCYSFKKDYIAKLYLYCPHCSRIGSIKLRGFLY